MTLPSVGNVNFSQQYIDNFCRLIYDKIIVFAASGCADGRFTIRNFTNSPAWVMHTA
jgi:hypothetical protein